MRPRSLFLPCVAVVAGLLLAGCRADPAEVLTAAATKTQDAKSSKMAIDISVAGQTSAEQVRITGEGAFDYAGRKGNLALQLPLSGEGGPLTRIDSVIVGDVVYQHFPAELGANLPTGKTWIKLDLKQLGDSNVAQGQSSDPTQALRFLRGVSGEVTEVGKENIRGEETTHYKATLDLRKAAEESGKDRASIDELIKQLGASTIPADIWIDEDGRMRRMRYEVDVKGAAAAQQGGQAKVAVGLELFEFGTEVKVTPPPADQVADASGLLGAGAGG
jgi:hypothetical protein